jgi:hypothetical protein
MSISPARLQRALRQELPFELLSASEEQQQFLVTGSAGTQYTVTIAASPSCSCPDSVHRRSRCKHQLMIMVRALGCDSSDAVLGKPLELADTKRFYQHVTETATE